MDGNQIYMLGLGLQALWEIFDQHLDTTKKSNESTIAASAAQWWEYVTETVDSFFRALMQ
ncbi:hypothetical protein AB835_14070 [Candidatus Endobugula sertula]|uniref:Uncharacterized protein n=1 Tax=Candidatus Endobugula sertula TaxID=62101 RepID=A0A1D2QLL5_9GAMM|nr:hypothetical protein AB835_14070 [Candidatus Endobugula sertula]